MLQVVEMWEWGQQAGPELAGDTWVHVAGRKWEATGGAAAVGFFFFSLPLLLGAAQEQGLELGRPVKVSSDAHRPALSRRSSSEQPR